MAGMADFLNGAQGIATNPLFMAGASIYRGGDPAQAMAQAQRSSAFADQQRQQQEQREQWQNMIAGGQLPESMKPYLPFLGPQQGAAMLAQHTLSAPDRARQQQMHNARLKLIGAQTASTDPTRAAQMHDARLALLRAQADKARAALNQPAGAFKTPKERFDAETKLRQEFTNINKDYTKVADAYTRIKATGNDAAGQMALIFNYMKMLDPGSTVREGEYATARNTTGVPGRVLNIYNKLIQGTELNPTQIAQFKGQAQRLFEAADKQFGLSRKRYEKYAGAYNMEPGRIVQDFGAGVRPAPVVAPHAASPNVPGVVVEGGNDPLGIR